MVIIIMYTYGHYISTNLSFIEMMRVFMMLSKVDFVIQWTRFHITERKQREFINDVVGYLVDVMVFDLNSNNIVKTRRTSNKAQSVTQMLESGRPGPICPSKIL